MPGKRTASVSDSGTVGFSCSRAPGKSRDFRPGVRMESAANNASARENWLRARIDCTILLHLHSFYFGKESETRRLLGLHQQLSYAIGPAPPYPANPRNFYLTQQRIATTPPAPILHSTFYLYTHPSNPNQSHQPPTWVADSSLEVTSRCT